MRTRSRHVLRRIFVGCEGDSEFHFAAWLADLTRGIVALDRRSLGKGAGAPRELLRKAQKQRERRTQQGGRFDDSILLVDTDRVGSPQAEAELRSQAAALDITIIFQRPNHEGLLVRLHQGKETAARTPQEAIDQLRALWPEYDKPMRKSQVAARFTIDDLLRLAKSSEDMRLLLDKLGLATVKRQR